MSLCPSAGRTCLNLIAWQATGLVVLAIGVISSAGAVQFSFKTLEVPGATATYANGISSGRIVGTYADTSNISHGFLLVNGVFSTIDYPGAEQTFGSGINEAGDVVGYYFSTGLSPHAYLLKNGLFVAVDIPGDVTNRGFGINANGDIVGDATMGGAIEIQWAFRISNGGHTLFDYPGGTFYSAVTYAFGINDRGDVIGTYAIGARERGYLRTKAGIFTEIAFPGASATIGYGINEKRHIVGVYFDAKGGHGFLLQDGVFTSIDVPGASSTEAVGISESGKIVGNYADRQSPARTHGFIATPY